MRLLYVAPRLPYPPLKGDQVVVFNRLRILGRRHEITLLTFYERDEDLEGLETLRDVCARVEAVHLPPWRSVASMAGLGLVTPTPFQVLYYRSKRFGRKLDELVRDGGFDVANAFLLRVAPYVERLAMPKVLDLIDSMQLAFERRVEVEAPPRRWAFAEELRRVRRYERSVGGAFDELLVVSEQDRALVPDQHVTIVPNGIDADAFAPDPAHRRPDPTVVFSGNLGFPSNAVAARWFVEQVWPHVRASVPATLLLVGANPSRSLRDLDGRDGVEVTGFVESMPETLRSAHVAVAPMQSGSGIQNKVLEAMASGLPTVATSLGLGGIRAEAGREVLVAEEPEEFAARVVELLRSPDRAEEIGLAARRFVVEQHSWESAARQVEEIYERLVAGRPAS